MSRIWSIGDTPDLILKLGDLQNAFAPQDFRLRDLENLSGINLSRISLDRFPLVGEQSLAQLVDAIPGLGNRRVNQIPPIRELFRRRGFEVNNRRRLGQLVRNNRNIRNLRLNSINLSRFSVTSIPNIRNATLENFHDWRSSFVSDIPGLGNVPLGQMPIPLTTIGNLIARIDVVFGSSERDRQNTVSGSYLEGFSVPCFDNCAHIELDDLENIGSALSLPFEGKQWINGSFQNVSGGSGCLAVVNNGLEPTGRHPFGSSFKMVLTDTDETTDLVRSSLFFRFSSFCGTSPFFIGPFPFLQFRRDDFIFLGG